MVRSNCFWKGFSDIACKGQSSVNPVKGSIRHETLMRAILILALIHKSQSALTSLSLSKCPSQFSITDANRTSVSNQQSKATLSSFYSVYDTPELSSTVDRLVIYGESSELGGYATEIVWPYIAVYALVLIFFVLMTVCYLFDQSCPPEGWRRNLKKDPYNKQEYRCVSLLTGAVGLGILITCLIGLSYIPSLRYELANTQCSVYRTLDAVLNGESGTSWGGFNNLNEKISNVSTLLSSSLPFMTTHLIGNDWLVNDMKEMKEMNLNIYRNHHDSTLVTPNPTTTKTALDNGLPVPTITSRFIDDDLGPNGTFGTMVDDIDRGLRLTQILTSEAYNIEISANRVIDSSSTVLSNIAESQQTLEMYISQLSSTVQTIDEVNELYWGGGDERSRTPYQQYLIYIIECVFGVMLAASFVSLLAIVAVYGFEVFACHSCMNCAWVCYGLCWGGVLVIIYTVLGMGSVAYGYCSYFDSMLNEQSAYNRIVHSYSQNPFNRLDECFFGEGNVLSKFNLEEEISTVTGVFEHMQTYYDFSNQLSTNYVDVTISTGKMTNWLSILDNYKKGIYVDYDPTVTTDDNPNYAVNSLNLYTEDGDAGGVPTCSKDRWVFDSINCTDTANEETFVAGTAANGQALTSAKDAICISFNERFSTLQNNEWTQSDFTRRYKQIRSGCPDAYEKILEYGYSIINYRDGREQLFQGLQDELTVLHTKNSQFNANITTFLGSVQSFESSASALNEIVTDDTDGLLASSDCRSIKDNALFAYNAFCINTMGWFVKIGICSIVLAVLGLIGLFSAYWWALWFKHLEENPRARKVFTAEDGELISEDGGTDKSVRDLDLEKGFEALGGVDTMSSSNQTNDPNGQIKKKKRKNIRRKSNQKPKYAFQKKRKDQNIESEKYLQQASDDNSEQSEEQNPYIK